MLPPSPPASALLINRKEHEMGGIIEFKIKSFQRRAVNCGSLINEEVDELGVLPDGSSGPGGLDQDSLLQLGGAGAR